MTPDLKAKWLTALRSGNYRQGRRYLRDNPLNSAATFCCLGVLCEVAEFPFFTDRAGNTAYGLPGKEAQATAYLTDDMLPVVGLSATIQTTLAGMNDRGVSFADIADAIEATPDLTLDIGGHTDHINSKSSYLSRLAAKGAI